MKYLERLKSKNGFTLTELMIGLGVTSILLIAFIGSFLGMKNTMYSQDSYFASNRTGYYAMNVISKDVREAISIEDVYGSDTTGTSVITLRLPSITAAGVPTDIDSDFDYVTYELSGTNLVRTLDVLNGTSSRNGGVDRSGQIVARNVTSLTFSNTSGTAFSSLSAAAQEALKIFNVAITSSENVAGQARSIVTNTDMMLMNK